MASMQVLAFCHPGYSSYRRIKQPIDKIARGAKIRWPRNRAANALAIPATELEEYIWHTPSVREDQ
jgi:hypothetical protein